MLGEFVRSILNRIEPLVTKLHVSLLHEHVSHNLHIKLQC